MTSNPEHPKSEKIIAVILIISVVGAILFAIAVGEVAAIVVGLPLFLGLSIAYSVLAGLFFWPKLRWKVVWEILMIPFVP